MCGGNFQAPVKGFSPIFSRELFNLIWLAGRDKAGENTSMNITFFMGELMVLKLAKMQADLLSFK